MYFEITNLSVVKDTGNVGIGTTSPEAMLDVNGVIQVSSYDYRIQTPADDTWGQRQLLALRAYPPHENRTVLVPAHYGFRVTDYKNDEINLELFDHGNLYIRKDVYSRGFPLWSDSRAKVERQPLDYGLAEVLKLNPERYLQLDWTQDMETGEIEIHEGGTNDIGLVAQDVYDQIPEAVTKPEDETRELWSLCSDKIIPVVVKAIQELHQIIEDQDAKIESLEERTEEQQEEIDSLKQRIDALEGREGGGS